MGYVFGGMVAFWGLYALLALIVKHEFSLIIMTILGFFAGLGTAIYRGEYTTLVSTAIGAVLVRLVAPIQVKSKAKAEWKNSRKSNNKDVKDDKDDKNK